MGVVLLNVMQITLVVVRAELSVTTVICSLVKQNTRWQQSPQATSFSKQEDATNQEEKKALHIQVSIVATSLCGNICAAV